MIFIGELCQAGPFCPVSFFFMMEAWPLTLCVAREACSYLDVVECFVTSWMSHHCALGVNLVVGSLTTVWITDDGSCCGSLESKDFKIYFVTLLRLIDLNYFLSYCCTWISVDLCMMFSIWGSFGVLHFVIEILPDKVMSWFKRWSWLKQW